MVDLGGSYIEPQRQDIYVVKCVVVGDTGVHFRCVASAENSIVRHCIRVRKFGRLFGVFTALSHSSNFAFHDTECAALFFFVSHSKLLSHILKRPILLRLPCRSWEDAVDLRACVGQQVRTSATDADSRPDRLGDRPLQEGQRGWLLFATVFGKSDLTV